MNKYNFVHVNTEVTPAYMYLYYKGFSFSSKYNLTMVYYTHKLGK